MPLPQEQEFQQRIAKIDRLVAGIAEIPDPAARAGVEELVQAILDLHGAGLERILELTVDAGDPGEVLIDGFTRDDLVRSLLLLHGLHPLDLEARVTQALDKVRPYLGSHGGNVELLGVTDGLVRLRLQGSCNGCASSAMTLKLAIEEAIQEFAPDIAGLAVEGVVEQPPPPAGFIPLTQVQGKRPRPPLPDGHWASAGNLSTLATGIAHVREVEGTQVCFCQVGGTFYAYGPICPGCGSALNRARVAGTTLECPGCDRGYDVMRAGRCLDQPTLHLDPFPLLVERGQVKVAIPVAV